MENQDWFLILLEWKKRMGSVGVTLPFLYAALKMKSDKFNYKVRTAEEIIEDIVNNPVEGHITQVQQCPDISETVLSTVKANDAKNRVIVKSSISRINGQSESLVFSDDFHYQYGLQAGNEKECLSNLLENARQHILKGEFSKLKKSIGIYEFGNLSDREIMFVHDTICNRAQ